MKETELKPCPFCGGEAKLKRAFLCYPHLTTRNYNEYYLEQNFVIECQKCGFETPEFNVSLRINTENLSLEDSLESQVEEYVKKWNRRAEDENTC